MESLRQPFFAELGARPDATGPDFSRVHVWWGDERFVPTEGPDRNAGHTLALLANGSVYSWGDNSKGQLGVSLPSFYGWTGLVFSMTLVYYTYIYLGVLAALQLRLLRSGESDLA